MWHVRSLCVAIPVRYFGELRQIDRLVEFRRAFVPLTAKEAREERRRRRKIGWDNCVRDPATAVIEYRGYECYRYRLTGGAVH